MEGKEVIVNPATKNEFDVIGHDSTQNLTSGIRFWIHNHSGKCYIGFRLRVVASEGAPKPISMEQTCKTAYPKVKWTGGSSIHGSVAGSIKTDFPAYMADAILDALKEGDTGGSLYDAFSAVFETMRLIYNREQFNTYFLMEIERLLKGEPGQNSKNVTIDFMGFTKETVPNEVVVAEPQPTVTVPLEVEPQTL